VKIVEDKASRNTTSRVANSRQSNTIIAYINAIGKSIPPMIIVKSLRGFNVLEGPVGSKWTCQQNAWTENILGVEWIKGVLLAHCEEERSQLIILDGHHSHEAIGIIDAAGKENILLCLPPHTTHFLCPLDRTVFGPLNNEYNKAYSFVSPNPVNTVDKKTWSKLFTSAFDQSVNSANIISGFRSCGTLLFNPLAVPSRAFTPSMTFENQPTESSSHQTTLFLG
jgi:hypothetical protein